MGIWAVPCRLFGALLWVVPRPLRNVDYRVFAGKSDECMVPSPELRARFLA